MNPRAPSDISDCVLQGEAGKGTEELPPSLAGRPGAGCSPGSLGSQNKTLQLSAPRDLRVSTSLVCGSCVRSITRETKIREENDKGREREEYRGSSRSKCSWKIKAPNKNQQNGKKANRRSKAGEQNAGREVSAKELISQTYESLMLKQKYHSPGSSLWSPLVIMGAMKRPGNKATFIFPL